VNFWPVDEYGYSSHFHFLATPDGGLRFQGDFPNPSRAVDYRIYQPRLLAEYEKRGGKIVVGTIEPADFDELGAKHDLIAVASGKAALGDYFGTRADRSPFKEPQRRLAVGLWKGVAHTEPNSVELSISAGQGELLAIPIYSHAGHVMALLFENIPGGALAHLESTPAADDPVEYRKLTLAALREHHPSVYERVDESAFELTGEADILQGGVTPVLRNDYRVLDDGTVVMALGDVQASFDPVVGQGANSASFSAEVLADAIAEVGSLDKAFADEVVRRRSPWVESVSEWTNLMVTLPPAPQLIDLLGAMSQNRALCDEFTANFNDPIAQWKMVSSVENAHAAIARHSKGANNA